MLSYAKSELLKSGYEWVAEKYLHEYCKKKLSQTGEIITINGKQILIDGKASKARKKTGNKWFETQDSIAYWDDFDKPKIAWASVGETYYSLIPQKYILLDTNYFFALDKPEYFMGLLNSKLIIWKMNTEDTAIGQGGAYRHYKYNLEKLCLPTENLLLSQFMEKNIQTILNNNNKRTEEIQKEIDKIVYSMYGLNDEEISFIENKS